MRIRRILPFFLGLGFLALANCQWSGGAQGEFLYQNYCANCHGASGEGLKALYPPLAGADYLREHQADLPCIIKYGMDKEIVVNGETYNFAMPGERSLTETEVANIINYINSAWGNDYGRVTFDAVRQKLRGCE